MYVALTRSFRERELPEFLLVAWEVVDAAAATKTRRTSVLSMTFDAIYSVEGE